MHVAVLHDPSGIWSCRLEKEEISMYNRDDMIKKLLKSQMINEGACYKYAEKYYI